MFNIGKNKKIELLPCPICGSNVYSRMRHKGTNCATEIFSLDICCNNSDCGLTKSIRLGICDTAFDDVANAIDNAVSSWNRRADTYMDDCK